MRFVFSVVLASLCMIAGVVLGGIMVTRFCQEVHCMGRFSEVPVVDSAALLETPTAVPTYVGGMALATSTPLALAAGSSPAADSGAIDVCPPMPADGLPVDTPVQAIGIAHLYPEPDTQGEALANHTAGYTFVVMTDEGGATAIARCDVVWYRVRDAETVEGWVLAAAVDRMPLPIAPAPTVLPCPQVGCVQPSHPPCGQPCTYPCNNQPSYPCYRSGV
jgi:hypothetical protein